MTGIRTFDADLRLRLKRRIGQLVEPLKPGPKQHDNSLPDGNVLRSVERKARSEAKTLAALRSIGDALGGRDHSTVLNLLRRKT